MATTNISAKFLVVVSTTVMLWGYDVINNDGTTDDEGGIGARLSRDLYKESKRMYEVAS